MTEERKEVATFRQGNPSKSFSELFSGVFSNNSVVDRQFGAKPLILPGRQWLRE